MLAIDALNEGDGKQLWRKHLAGFLADLRRFPGIRVALSVRSTYEDVCIPKHITEHLLKIFHPGFADNEYKATETFFAHYKIKRPSIPMLVPEFQSPLLLNVLPSVAEQGNDRYSSGTSRNQFCLQFLHRIRGRKIAGPGLSGLRPHVTSSSGQSMRLPT